MVKNVWQFVGGKLDWGRTQILWIIEDSRVGTCALVAMPLTIYAKVHAIAAVPEKLKLQAWMHIVSRYSTTLFE
jgi:cobalamin synthase